MKYKLLIESINEYDILLQSYCALPMDMEIDYDPLPSTSHSYIYDMIQYEISPALWPILREREALKTAWDALKNTITTSPSDTVIIKNQFDSVVRLIGEQEQKLNKVFAFRIESILDYISQSPARTKNKKFSADWLAIESKILELNSKFSDLQESQLNTHGPMMGLESAAKASVGLFAKTEIKKPNYTIRMLLSSLSSDKEGDAPKLKPFSHFTLACTHDNEASVADSFDALADYLKGPLTLTADEVVNIGTEEKPLWAVRLNLGENGTAFRAELSRLFDDIMCHEMNGVRFLWNPTGDQETKSPHITIGSSAEDRQKANDLVNGHYGFTFERMDYKQLGPNDPQLTKELTAQAKETMGMRK